VQRLGALRIFSEVDDALADADGAVRKEFRMSGERRRQIHLTWYWSDSSDTNV
jgi:hypothetical protein